MHLSSLIAIVILGGGCTLASNVSYVDWKTFSPTGVNLGGWLEQEASVDPGWWDTYGGSAPDEWTLCAALGSRCGSVLEERYATFITTADIDRAASAGISALRIPLTYAAFVRVPGSQLYSGNQTQYLKAITDYAIAKYGMHIIIGLHSLPGGVNGVGIGEKTGNYGWWNNETALEYSYQAVEGIIDFIQKSGSPQSYTLSPINEPADVQNLTSFSTPASITEDGASYLTTYIKGVLSRVKAVNSQIPVMFQASFKPESYWSPRFDASANMVIDTHNYYFYYQPATSSNISDYICADAKSSASDGKFPVWIGEWAIQTQFNNTLESRATNLNNGLYAWAKYTQGSAYWNLKYLGNTTVSGEGITEDYWNFESFIAMGIINPNSSTGFCP
ncbi:putative exo-beta-1,3-glucanase [Coleophoma crateriformis]|uniref:glucan 1,3-beta-glucosidase n=1 Tax=Coleophoma crateriformis TaxID=565419 RepID=A0A3D8R3R1_9HELO|nr:putative exo-beta-1,3-glucanase [Coleophoma crateriformis]